MFCSEEFIEFQRIMIVHEEATAPNIDANLRRCTSLIADSLITLHVSQSANQAAFQGILENINSKVEAGNLSSTRTLSRLNEIEARIHARINSMRVAVNFSDSPDASIS